MLACTYFCLLCSFMISIWGVVPPRDQHSRTSDGSSMLSLGSLPHWVTTFKSMIPTEKSLMSFVVDNREESNLLPGLDDVKEKLKVHNENAALNNIETGRYTVINMVPFFGLSSRIEPGGQLNLFVFKRDLFTDLEQSLTLVGKVLYQKSSGGDWQYSFYQPAGTELDQWDDVYGMNQWIDEKQRKEAEHPAQRKVEANREAEVMAEIMLKHRRAEAAEAELMDESRSRQY